MKKTFTIFLLFYLFSNSYAQRPNCAGILMDMENEKRQKIIEDFITASEKDTMFGNGRLQNIGKQNTDEEILKAGLKNENWNWENITPLKSIDHENYKYLLFSYHKGEKFNLQLMALYNKTNFTFRTYDPYFYKNYQHPEVLGKWNMSEGIGVKENQEITLKPYNKLEYGNFIEIKEDFTFITYLIGDCPPDVTISGRYSFDAEGKITFYCNDIWYFFDKKKKGKPFVSGPFSFTKEENILILKK